MVPNIDNKIIIIQHTIKIVVDPPPQAIMAKVDIGAAAHCFTQDDAHEFVNVRPTNIRGSNRKF